MTENNEMRQYADLILTGATIYCGKGLPSDYDFIAVKGNHILTLGKGDEMEGLLQPKTKVIKLKRDQLLLPGLHDHHIHLIQAGMLEKYIDVSASTSQEEAANMIGDFAKTIPDETWVIGFGWCRLSWQDKALPKKEVMDEVLPDRPVLLLDSELHGAWVNSKALQLCGVNRETKDPEFGTIDRNDKGEPSGYLYETALSLVAKHAFNFSDEIIEELIVKYMKKANQYGITSVGDMTPYLGIDLSYPETYLRMNRQGRLTVRINAARNLFEDIDQFKEIQKKALVEDTGMYRIPYMKQFIDGVIANYTALLLSDYSDKPGEKGGSLLDLERLNHAVEIAHENQISVRLHACGDGAVHVALNAYENAIKKYGRRKGRHQIEHIELICPEDIKRFRELGIIASVQPEHIVSGIGSFSNNCYPQLLGERERYTWAFRSLLDSGGVLACGSDSPVVEGNPFEGMYTGLERIHPDKTPEGGWNSSEKITIEELIHGYTYGAAYGEGREDELGTLEVGKLADLVVLDTDLLKATSEEIRETEALMTVVDGNIVFCKDESLLR